MLRSEGGKEMNIFADVLGLTILFAVPLILVAMGGMCSERSGIVNIALEGIMVIGALISCIFLSMVNASGWGIAHPQSAVMLAILISAASGTIYAMFLAFASVNLKADQTIGGTALNMLAPAFAIVLSWALQGQGQTTIFIPNWVRITPQQFGVPADEALNFFERMFINKFFLTTPVAILLFAIITIVLYKTKFGLRLRACGEHPQAADSVGVSVYGMRYAGVALSGMLAGVGGLAFTLAVGGGFQSSVAGYGFLALAVMIFGNWKPLRIFGAAFLFAVFKVIAPMASSIPFLPTFSGIKGGEYLYLMLPYLVTMIVLAFTSKKSRAPKAEGIPYDKGSR